ncbi:MAG TPA: hypothetical protein VFY76_01635 [Nocardioides sp.]|nr:hypothetical protein [Nocardioides sp.]
MSRSSHPDADADADGTWRWTVAAAALVTTFLALFVRVGGDWDWLVAMGDVIRATMRVPDGVPFAASDTSGWHNVPVLAQLVASVVHDVGARATVIAHMVVVTVTLLVLARAARSRGASDLYTAAALVLLGAGALATLGIVRAQTLSLVPFALLVALISGQARRPDRGIWWAVPLVALWGNLHGAALLGVCVLGAYLVGERIRLEPGVSVAVGASSLLALCATPQLWRTPLYYAEVFDNVSAQRGTGLWARPSADMPFDVLMLVAAAGLGLVWMRSRRQPWEYIAVIGLCVATASAARHGTWLLLLLVVLSGSAVSSNGRTIRDRRGLPSLRTTTIFGGIALAVALPVVVVRGDAVLGAPPDVVAGVAETAGRRVVLAPAPLSESLAVEGVTLWAGNPLDAFSHPVQAGYLDFLDGGVGAADAVRESDVVVAEEGSAQAELMSGFPEFEPRRCAEGWVCYIRR